MSAFVVLFCELYLILHGVRAQVNSATMSAMSDRLPSLIMFFLVGFVKYKVIAQKL